MLTIPITSFRWFRGKARQVASCLVADRVPLGESGAALVLVEVAYVQGEPERYALYLRDDDQLEAPRDALEDRAVAFALLQALASGRRCAGEQGELAACSTPGTGSAAAAGLEPRLIGAEQSNSSIAYGERYVLKLYRRVEAGVHSDLEVSQFLTAKGFPHAPAVRGHLEYRPRNGEAMVLGMLQDYVLNDGDGWAYTLAALDRGAEGYESEARLLGERTAELHRVLASDAADPSFAPEPFTREVARAMGASARSLAEGTLDLLSAREGALPQGVRGLAAEVLGLRERLLRQLSPPDASLRFRSLRLRCHGDYHLGQVLRASTGFVITDFEGEVTRPLADRRRKSSPLRDVAGMLRSFHYAAEAWRLDPKRGEGERHRLQPQLEAWHEAAGAAFLDGYRRRAAGAGFLDCDSTEAHWLLRFHTLEKAVYELGYELNNRPAWVRIPLAGVLNVLSTAHRK